MSLQLMGLEGKKPTVRGGLICWMGQAKSDAELS